jgi:hypothetical protein
MLSFKLVTNVYSTCDSAANPVNMSAIAKLTMNILVIAGRRRYFQITMTTAAFPKHDMMNTITCNVTKRMPTDVNTTISSYNTAFNFTAEVFPNAVFLSRRKITTLRLHICAYFFVIQESHARGFITVGL